MDMENMDNSALYLLEIYLLTNEYVGDGNCMFNTIGAYNVVIRESSHNSLQVNFMNQIMGV